MARVLIVGCGCRGRALAEALARDGHAVRGTTRSAERTAAIEAVGAEAVAADPARLATLSPALEGVTVICWLMGTAGGDREAVAALHGPRLDSMLAAIVDTPVRGVVYEAAGTVPAGLLERGGAALRRAAVTYRMPVASIERDPDDPGPWLADARSAVDRVLAA